MMSHNLRYNSCRRNAYGDKIRFYNIPTISELGLFHICKNPFTKKYDDVSYHIGLSVFNYSWDDFLSLIKER